MPSAANNKGNKIVIAGLGVMGASLAMTIRQNNPGVQLIGYDSAEVLAEALKMGIIDQSISRWPEECQQADIIFLATPLKIISQQIEQLNGIVGKETLVSDLGSTKMVLSEFVRQINFSGTYVGGHPMTGAEKSGIKAANPLLYENAIYILTGVTSANEVSIRNKLIPLLESLKARIMFLSAEDHDKILASISHLPQLLAIALVNLVGQKNVEDKPYLDLAAGGFRDLTRIASSSIDIWQDIITSNRDNVRQALQEFIDMMQAQLNSLDNLSAPFESANNYRNQVPKRNKGFLSPLSDILVYVTDQVGVVAKISTALTARDIDIRDMELLKIREKEGGVFRLSLANDREALEAVKILNNIGFKAFIRE